MTEVDQPTLTIFAMDDKKTRPIAFALDPDKTGTERLRMFVRSQVLRIDPKTIFYNVSGVYEEVSATEFDVTRTKSDKEITNFVEEVVAALKGPYTMDIIFSDPPKRS